MGNMDEPPSDHHDGDDTAAAPARPRMDARAKLDVIYQEVLGEVTELVGRVEKSSTKLLKAETLNASVAAAIQKAHQEAGRQLRDDIAAGNARVLEGLKTPAREVRMAAAAVQATVRRVALLALVIGGGAGLLGGMLGAYLVASGGLARLAGH